MSKPKVFISYSHLDEPWKDRLVKHLGIAQKQGLLQTWNDRDLLGGDDWFAEIINAIEQGSVAVLLVSHNSLTSSFILNEEAPRMLARREVKAARFYPIVVEDCDWEAVEWLKQFNLRPRDGRPVGLNKDGVRTEEQINRDLKEIAKEIRLLPPPQPAVSPTPEPLTGECPYLGLEAFTEETKHLFFGRDDFADALFAKVKRQNFVALVGPSGSGKSSVVQAGLFPRLRRDAQLWATILFPPREDPFLSLAAGFVWHWQPQANYAVNTNEAKKLAAKLKDAQRLIEAIQHTVATPDGRLLLVVDQFEEIFTLCAENDRRAFLDVLMAVKDAAPVAIMLTLRSDFMGQAQSFSPAFSQLLDDGIVSHRPLTRDDLKNVITGPARYAGLEFEPGLVNLILEEVAGQHDSLPLLEYALKEMWCKRQSRMFDYALYEAVGKVEGAISQHADAVLSALPEAEQALALHALTRLVRVAGEEGEADTRLRLPLGEMPEAERAVLQTFVTARLLVTKREEGAGTETIEVAHEALIRRWEKLREAVDGDREFLMWRRRLDSRRKAWEQKGRDDKWLLYGGERDDAQRWLNEGGAELTAAEIEFIIWDDRPDFQIERILSKGPSLLLSSDAETRKSWFVTLVFCSEKEMALSIVREIEDGSSRAEALSLIVEALVKAGMVTDALAAARELEHWDAHTKDLSSIAEALVKAGMASQALAFTREIEPDYFRIEALSSIADELVKAGMATEALAAAHEFEVAFPRAMTLSSIASALAKAGMTTEAHEAATDAHEAATDVLAAAREDKDGDHSARALRSIAAALAKAGMATEACEAATEAMAAARKIEDAHRREWAFSSIAESLAKAEMAAEAVSAAREIEDTHRRAWAFSSIAKSLAKAGMVVEALAAASELGLASERAKALSSIAEALVKVEMVTEALAAAHAIEIAYNRAEALSSIAEALVKAEMATWAREAAAEALATGLEIEDMSHRALALGSIARSLAKAGMAMEAREAAIEGLAAARKVQDADDRAQALMAVADFWLELRRDYEAQYLLEEVQGAISKVFDDEERSEAMRRLSIILARLHSYRAARETAEQCSRSSNRLAAYTAILREYHIERDPSLAQLFAEEE